MILAAVAFAACAACRPAGHPAPPQPEGLILISIVTLRADHLVAYGHPGRISPALDRRPVTRPAAKRERLQALGYVE